MQVRALAQQLGQHRAGAAADVDDGADAIPAVAQLEVRVGRAVAGGSDQRVELRRERAGGRRGRPRTDGRSARRSRAGRSARRRAACSRRARSGRRCRRARGTRSPSSCRDGVVEREAARARAPRRRPCSRGGRARCAGRRRVARPRRAASSSIRGRAASAVDVAARSAASRRCGRTSGVIRSAISEASVTATDAEVRPRRPARRPRSRRAEQPRPPLADRRHASGRRSSCCCSAASSSGSGGSSAWSCCGARASWTLRDKLIGTLLWPGGLVTGGCTFLRRLDRVAELRPGGEATLELAASRSSRRCSSRSATAVYLARRAKHSSSS